MVIAILPIRSFPQSARLCPGLPATEQSFAMRTVTSARAGSMPVRRLVRARAWQRLATHLVLEKLALKVSEIWLENVLTVAGAMRRY
ncbi:hypothetical protein EWE75_13660 [Sphingomonas populi]|uniref:Uncharacterized protein n=1 Tax=Sphingomonas populi TaxID=2484750 RepID=A0A4Q6Y2B0_9SPHN|nr:hypothetical protein [Sphingomonas populi]RZF63844.1 hypothetical protein EWE75_13660 [Sphingomonas populi]